MELSMANEKNLIPQNKRTKSERRKIAQQGGIASGKSRNDKKKFKDVLKTLLDSKPSIVELERLKSKYPDIDITEITYRGLIGISMIGKATGVEEFMKADVAAAQFLRDSIGEKPSDKVEAIVSDKVDPLISALNPRRDFKNSKR